MSRNVPLIARPTGVRIASTMTASDMDPPSRDPTEDRRDDVADGQVWVRAVGRPSGGVHTRHAENYVGPGRATTSASRRRPTLTTSLHRARARRPRAARTVAGESSP